MKFLLLFIVLSSASRLLNAAPHTFDALEKKSSELLATIEFCALPLCDLEKKDYEKRQQKLYLTIPEYIRTKLEISEKKEKTEKEETIDEAFNALFLFAKHFPNADLSMLPNTCYTTLKKYTQNLFHTFKKRSPFVEKFRIASKLYEYEHLLNTLFCEELPSLTHENCTFFSILEARGMATSSLTTPENVLQTITSLKKGLMFLRKIKVQKKYILLFENWFVSYERIHDLPGIDDVPEFQLLLSEIYESPRDEAMLYSLLTSKSISCLQNSMHNQHITAKAKLDIENYFFEQLELLCKQDAFLNRKLVCNNLKKNLVEFLDMLSSLGFNAKDIDLAIQMVDKLCVEITELRHLHPDESDLYDQLLAKIEQHKLSRTFYPFGILAAELETPEEEDFALIKRLFEVLFLEIPTLQNSDLIHSLSIKASFFLKQFLDLHFYTSKIDDEFIQKIDSFTCCFSVNDFLAYPHLYGLRCAAMNFIVLRYSQMPQSNFENFINMQRIAQLKNKYEYWGYFYRLSAFYGYAATGDISPYLSALECAKAHFEAAHMHHDAQECASLVAQAMSFLQGQNQE